MSLTLFEDITLDPTEQIQAICQQFPLQSCHDEFVRAHLKWDHDHDGGVHQPLWATWWGNRRRNAETPTHSHLTLERVCCTHPISQPGSAGASFTPKDYSHLFALSLPSLSRSCLEWWLCRMSLSPSITLSDCQSWHALACTTNPPKCPGN